MSAAHRMLYAEKRKNGINEDVFRAILLGQLGTESSKGISWSSAKRCVREMQKHSGNTPDEKPYGEWRKPSDDPLIRKCYALWGVLRRGGSVKTRYPDGYVKKMTGCDRAEFLTPAQANVVIEGLKKWAERDGLK